MQNLFDDDILNSRNYSTDPEEEIEQSDDDGREDQSETPEDQKENYCIIRLSYSVQLCVNQ